jgi:hypothetical protein
LTSDFCEFSSSEMRFPWSRMTKAAHASASAAGNPSTCDRDVSIASRSVTWRP